MDNKKSTDKKPAPKVLTEEDKKDIGKLASDKKKKKLNQEIIRK